MRRAILLLVERSPFDGVILRLSTVDAAGRPHNVAWEAAACAGAVRAGRSRAWAACRER